MAVMRKLPNRLCSASSIIYEIRFTSREKYFPSCFEMITFVSYTDLFLIDRVYCVYVSVSVINDKVRLQTAEL